MPATSLTPLLRMLRDRSLDDRLPGGIYRDHSVSMDGSRAIYQLRDDDDDDPPEDERKFYLKQFQFLLFICLKYKYGCFK